MTLERYRCCYGCVTGRTGNSQTDLRLADLMQLTASLEPDADERRRLAGLAVEHVEAFLTVSENAPTLRTSSGIADALAAFGIPDAAREPAEVFEVLGRLVDTPGVATTSPRYFGYIPSGGLYTAALGDFLAAASNRYAGQASISPGAAGLEHVVVRWLADSLGLGPDAGGVLTSGGSAGALTAIVAARDTAGVLEATAPTPVVYLTDHTHHSIDVALRVAGLARAVVRRIPLDRRYRMNVAALDEVVRSDRRAGLRPFLVVGTAGTTNSGSVDPLRDIAEVAERENLWFHVDGAYGGLFALCKEAGPVLEGLDRADSVVVDPHKTLFLPYGIGAVLVRDRDLLKASFGATADYLAPPPAEEPASPAELGFELTRHFRALRLWLPLQLAGRSAFSAALAEKLLLARHVHEHLGAAPEIEVGPSPDLSIVTFRPRTSEPGDHAAEQLASSLQRHGEVFLTTTRLDGRLVLRMAVGSFRTHLADVDTAVDVVLRELGRRPAPRTSTSPATVRSPAAPDLIDVPVRTPALRLEFLPGPPDAAVIDCEVAVLAERYGNTADELRDAYGSHDDVTACLAVRDAAGAVLGWARLVTPGPLPLKTLSDASRPPWALDVEDVTARLGMDVDRTWDVATLGVRRELGAAGSRIAAALYHGIILATRTNGAAWIVAMIDVRVQALLRRLGLVMHRFPGAHPRPYLGSRATVPVYANMDTGIRTQRRRDPDAYHAISLGAGLEGIAIPERDAFVLPALQEVDLRSVESRPA